jgi:hypothetical protein
LSQVLESLPFAGVLAFAGILCALARGLTLTRIDAIAMHLRFIGASRGERTNTEQKRGGRGQCSARDGLGQLHLKLLLMIKIADERLNKVSHLTAKETATPLRLLQDDWKIVRPTVQDCKELQSVEQEARSSRATIETRYGAVHADFAPTIHI